MEISWWRDLVIVIWGLVATVAVTIITVVACILYKRVVRVLDSADSIAVRTNDLIDYAEEEVLKPAVQFGTLIQGVIQGAGLIADLFKKKEGKKDE
jgi:hypothetical protein